ncbi:MAG: hypothetical protein KGD59_01700 [Candidatus Heimdallarchaeota archaeon]|nr:hypothetical protein [Candidatus Heimdallarchaeota archaeon]MBY8993234.1 hypothetical protein [Candidatus Heimdallarchaeota archaeon]
MIEFRNYDELLLDDQIDLIKDVIKDWNWVIWYPNKASLTESYSRVGFSPETRHYAFDGDKMVGFLSSTIEREIEGVSFGSLHIPFIRKGYEHIEEELVKKTIETLKSKGAQAIRSFAMPGWGNTIQILEKHGFKEKKLLSYATMFSVDLLVKDDYKKSENIEELDLPRDKQKLIKLVVKESKQPKEVVERYLNNLIWDDAIVACTIVYKRGDASFGYLAKGLRYLDIPGRIFLSFVPVVKKEAMPLFKEIIEEGFGFLAQKAKEAGYNTLWYEARDIENVELYEELGLKMEPTFGFTLRI